MASSPRPVTHGTVGATAITVDLAKFNDSRAATKVRLTANYTRNPPTDIPSPPSMTGAAASGLCFPRQVPSGTTLTLHKGEADALVAAGAATYV